MAATASMRPFPSPSNSSWSGTACPRTSTVTPWGGLPAAFTARRNFKFGFVQGLFSKADARDRITGEATPEAPRQIWDVLATVDKLPFHLHARGQYEEVGRKSLGNGFIAVPVREFRGALVRPFASFDLGMNVFLVSGYGGQTLETIALPGEGEPFERITGFPLKSYVSASFTYHFRRR